MELLHQFTGLEKEEKEKDQPAKEP